MSRHSSYHIFIPRENLWSALTIIAGFAEQVPDRSTTFIFPDCEIALPFMLSREEESRVAFDGALRDHSFTLSLYITMDPVVEEYVKGWRDDVRDEFPGEWEPPFDALGRVGIGYFYLSVGGSAHIQHGDGHTADLVPLSLSVASSSMNPLFEESPSVRQLFITIAETAGAIYVILDREIDAILVWLNGERRNDPLPDADLPLREIERIAHAKGAGR